MDNTEKPITNNVIHKSKSLCFKRCIFAIALSCGMQFFLLTEFLFIVKIDFMHPIQWVTDTISIVLSANTWFSTIPLLGVVLLNGILLGKLYLLPRKFYRSRFNWLIDTGPFKLASLITLLVLGFLTAWLYSSFLHVDYSGLFYPCFGTQCLNVRCTFLLFDGIAVAFYFFAQEHLRREPVVEFPIIQTSMHIKIRTLLCKTVYTSLRKSFAPTCCFALFYCLFGGFVNRLVAAIFVVDLDESPTSIYTLGGNVYLLFYAWVLSAQILSNMHLMQELLSLHLSHAVYFPIERSSVLTAANDEMTLVDALTIRRIPILQTLAAWHLYMISTNRSTTQRQEIFALSVPGGHANNWNQLSCQCLNIIDEFTNALCASVNSISTIDAPSAFGDIINPCASDAAEKILLQQYNAMYGVRHMVTDTRPSSVNNCSTMPNTAVGRQAQRMSNACQRLSANIDQFSEQLNAALCTAFHTIPGLFYTFGEQDGAHTAYLLSNSQSIVWLTLGLSGICAASMTEDKFGVVQVKLPQIIKALLRLKMELDKLNNVNLNGKKSDRNLITLKVAVKRSLYKICTVFGDYLADLMDDPLELRALNCFVLYQET